VICFFIRILFLTKFCISGLGFGMIYLPSIVSVGYYFEKKRAMATGIAVCGSGIGTFIFSPSISTAVRFGFFFGSKGRINIAHTAQLRMMPACKNSKFLQSKTSNKKSFRGEKINVPIPDPGKGYSAH
jgi:MFS family permease